MVSENLPIHSHVDRLHCSRAIPISHRPKRNFTCPGRSYLIITSSRASSHIQYLFPLYRFTDTLYQVTNRPKMSKSRVAPPPLLSRSSISSDETPLQTPSFTPNAPAEYITKADLSLKELEKDAVKAEKASDLDLDLPISTLLREGTKRAHVQAENSAGAEALVKGELPLEEYIKWLAVLWRVYE
jgi:hypothetical protein